MHILLHSHQEFSVYTRMDNRFPKRSVRMRSISLGRGVFRGNWAVVLEQMINYLGIETKVVVKSLSYYDGSALAKYCVALKLPSELKMGLKMPYGEAKHVEIASSKEGQHP